MLRQNVPTSGAPGNRQPSPTTAMSSGLVRWSGMEGMFGLGNRAGSALPEPIQGPRAIGFHPRQDTDDPASDVHELHVAAQRVPTGQALDRNIRRQRLIRESAVARESAES